MSNLNIACLLSPMADTEGPMEVTGGNILTGSKKIMGKYGEVGLEATITFGEENPNRIHADILTVGTEKEVTSLQQTAIAMIQPGKFPGGLGVHALNLDEADTMDAFAVAELLAAMIAKLENKPQLIFAGRESFDYGHGILGPALAQKLGMPYYSGVDQISLDQGLGSVTATFIEGNDKLVYNIPLPAVFGTTDWLNGKDSARFTSLKGVMMAKRFTRNIVSLADLGVDLPASRTKIGAIEPVTSERKNRKLEGDDGAALAKQAVDILVNQDKVLAAGDQGAGDTAAAAAATSWTDAKAADLDLAKDVVVIADHDGRSVRKSTHQVLSQARAIADATGKKVSLVLLAQNPDGLGASCAGFGTDRVVGVAHEGFAHPTVGTCSQAVRALFTADPEFLVLVANDLGRDLAANLAEGYGGGLLQDVVSLAVENGVLSGRRIVSNARFTTHERITAGGKCQVVSARATAFDPVPQERPTEYFRVSAGELASSATLKEVVAGEKTQGVPLNEAKIIVSGGRGLKAAENFKHLDTLASLLGGTVGASRAVTDVGWVPHNLQIGQTGTTVAPNIYFAIGISGAIQHLTGMLGSKYIVAVNPDADAPIHKHADLSVIDKWENFLSAFTDEVRQALGK